MTSRHLDQAFYRYKRAHPFDLIDRIDIEKLPGDEGRFTVRYISGAYCVSFVWPILSVMINWVENKRMWQGIAIIYK
jgi:hypothetical protein